MWINLRDSIKSVQKKKRNSRGSREEIDKKIVTLAISLSLMLKRTTNPKKSKETREKN